LTNNKPPPFQNAGVDIVNWSPVLYGILFLTFWKGGGLLFVKLTG